jgi:hypothetical protein
VFVSFAQKVNLRISATPELLKKSSLEKYSKNGESHT